MKTFVPFGFPDRNPALLGMNRTLAAMVDTRLTGQTGLVSKTVVSLYDPGGCVVRLIPCFEARVGSGDTLIIETFCGDSGEEQ